MYFRKPNPTADALRKLDQSADQMCACKDKACADKVNDEMTRWATQMAKDEPDLTTTKPDADDMKHAEETVKRYSDCMMKAMSVTP
jgi:hypothetical protein